MTGNDAYNDKYERMSLKKIEKSCFDCECYLLGFYYYLIIKRSYKTAYEYLSYVIKFLSDFNIAPEHLNVDNYYKFMASLKNKSSSEQIGAYHALQKYSKYLASKGICDDYMMYIDRPKFKETQETINKREVGFLTKKETKIMIDSMNKREHRGDAWKARDYAMIMIFLSSGIRCSALYKLDVKDVNIEEKYIVVHEKGNKERVINIPDQTIEAIKIWLSYRNEILCNNPEENALIISQHKRRMESESIYVVIRKIGRVITGKNITPHKLRATYGTNLYDATKDLYFVQSCMGHTSPSTTEIYIRGQKSDISKKASNIMNNFLN